MDNKLKTLDDVDIALGIYRKTEATLTAIQAELDRAIECQTSIASRKMKPLTVVLAKTKTILDRFILDNRDRLFNVHQKSVKLINGVIGIRKKDDTLEIDDPDKTVLLIRRYFPERLTQVVRITEVPLKPALKTWQDWELTKVGVQRKSNGSEPFFTPLETNAKSRAKNSRK